MWELVHLALIFAPGGYVLLRFQFVGKDMSQSALVVALLFTYVMLFIQFNGRRELANDHRTACGQFQAVLLERNDEAMADPDLVDEWDACYRHSAEYIQAEVDFRANEAANR